MIADSPSGGNTFACSNCGHSGQTLHTNSLQGQPSMTSRVVTRLTAPIATLSVLLLALAVIAAWYVHDMQERSSGPIAMSVSSVTAAQELEISIREVAAQ